MSSRLWVESVKVDSSVSSSEIVFASVATPKVIREFSYILG